MSNVIRSILEGSKPKKVEAVKVVVVEGVSSDLDYALKAIASDLISTGWTTASPEQKKQAQDRLEVVRSFWDEGANNYLLQTSFDPGEGELEQSPVAFLIKATEHGGKSVKAEAKTDSADSQIKAIFAKHNITPDKGMEGFWDAVDEVAELESKDGDELERLADEWEEELQAKFNTEGDKSPADEAYEAAKDLRPAIEQMLDSIAAICESIDAELGDAMAPGLKAAVISALRNGAGDVTGSKFDLETAKARIAEYYDQHEEE